MVGAAWKKKERVRLKRILMFRIPMVWSIEKKERTVLYGEEGAKG